MNNAQQRKALRTALSKFRHARIEAFAKIPDAEKLRERAREIKRIVSNDPDHYIGQLTEHLTSRGVKVFRATTKEAAVKYVLDIATRNRIKLIVKSKSMTTEEIDLNHHLEANGIRVVDTDLGERIIQLAHEKPSHIIAPAIHKSRGQIAELFTKDVGHVVLPEPQKITAEARKSLRESFVNASMGISGVNMAIAETGTIILVSNEGNARIGTAAPRIHVAIMGEEKIVPTLADAGVLIQLLIPSATGQKISSYVSFLSGPTPTLDHKGTAQHEMHLVILDNGRSTMRANPYFRDALNCLRCGACLNVCPTYGVVGGHVFGRTYTGAIGIPWTAYTLGMEEATSFAPLCIGCGLCEDACPVKINIPELIIRVKAENVKINGQTKTNSFIAKLDQMSELANKTAPLSNWLLRWGFSRWLLEKTTGIDRRRPIPRYHRETFMKWFKKHHTKGEAKVAYFVDTFANYNDPDIGKAVVDVLERNNTEIAVPEQKSAGMPLILYGDVEKAKEIMRFNVESLQEWVGQGYLIAASEPTAAYCLKKLYPAFLETPEAEKVAANTFDFFEYVVNLKNIGKLDMSFEKKMSGTAGYHAPCHTKSQFHHKPAMEILELLGFSVKYIDEGCCGIAGTFGYKQGYEGYDVSMAVGQPLFEAFRNTEISVATTESSVCKLQIEHGTEREVIHPVKLMSKAYAM